VNLTNNNAINILFYICFALLCIIRLAYAVWMVEEVIKANESTGNELYFMYDIACTLHSHLCVSHCSSSISFKVYNSGLYLTSYHSDLTFWRILLCVYLFFTHLATKWLVRYVCT